MEGAEIDRQIASNKRVRDVICDQLHSKPFNTDASKIFLLTAYLSIAIEHHEAIDLLAQNERYVSSFALLRSLAETVLRGLWVNACANETQISKLVTNDKNAFPGMEKMALDVDSKYGTKTYFQNFKQKWWNPMCSYAHSGLLQVTRQHGSTDGFIGPNFEEQEVLEVLQGATHFLAILTVAILRSHKYDKEAKDIVTVLQSAIKS